MGNDHSKITRTRSTSLRSGVSGRALIFGNGVLHKKFLREIQKGDYIIGVDRAAYWLLTNNIIPHVAIGDFDSATKKEFGLIKKSIKIIKKFPREKNFTDMELALNYSRGETIIFGATGKRLDHFLATMHLLKNHTLIDEYNRIRVIGRGKTVIKRSSYRYISLLPYTKSISVSLTGFKYEVKKKLFKKESSLGVSNELAAHQGVIEIFSGRAWVIESND